MSFNHLQWWFAFKRRSVRLWGKQAFFYVSVEFVSGDVETPQKEKETGDKGALAIA